MSSQSQPLSSIRLPGQRKRHIAQNLLKLYSASVRPATQPFHEDTIRIVCISDTHGTRPELPPGDVLVHAGDLTENGSFDEIQTELRWLSSQPHRYKVFVAGNHDVLLDENFMQSHPERRNGSSRTKNDLDWGSVIYLQNSSIMLDFPRNPQSANESEVEESSEYVSRPSRRLMVYGSPFTPQYGTSAFQYSPDPHFWAALFEPLCNVPEVLVTHGPPKLHLDSRGFHRAGCPYLAVEVARIRPRLHVFGHIHASYGREDCVLHHMQRSYEDVMVGWGGWHAIGWMVARLIWERLIWFFRGFRTREERLTTTFINAAVVGGSENQLVNEAVIFDI